MRFSDIISEGFKLTWRYPWFWIIGFAMYPQLLGETPVPTPEAGGEFALGAAVALLLYALAVGLIALLAGAILQPGLIIAAAYAHGGTPLKAGEALRRGYDYFGRFLLMTLLLIGIGIALAIMLVLPCAIAFIASKILGVVVVVFFIPLFIVLAITLTCVGALAYRNLVMLNLNVGASFSQALTQFRSKMWSVVGLVLALALMVIIVVFPLTLVITLIQTAVRFSTDGSLIVSLVSYGIAALLSVPILGFTTAFGSVTTTVAYQEWFMRPAEKSSDTVDSPPGAAI